MYCVNPQEERGGEIDRRDTAAERYPRITNSVPCLAFDVHFGVSLGSPHDKAQVKRTLHLPVIGHKNPVRGIKPGYLSTWPAHVTSQIVQQRQSPSSQGKTRNLGCDDEFCGPIGKPRFLQLLEGYLRRELQALDLHHPKVQEHRLQAYREVFDCFIEDFKTYKPLLSAIKNEYEKTLAHMQAQVRELEQLRTQLVTLAEQGERRVLKLRKMERAEVRTLKGECQRLQGIIQSMREEQNSLQTQVSFLQKDLADQYLMYREERDARQLLITHVNCLSYGLEDELCKEKEEEETEDPIIVKLALKVCREDLTRAQVELNRLQAEYGDVVPRRDWEILDRAHQQNLLKLATLQADFSQMKTEYDTLLDVHKQVVLQRDGLQGELQDTQRTSTPRPDWVKCADLLGGHERWAEVSDGQSSQRLLEVLLEKLSGTAAKQEDFFTGLGSVEDVPVYLQYEGKLKNLRLTKSDLVEVIKDIWKEKVIEEEQREEVGELPNFLHRYLESRYGEQAGDWAYSLADGCQQHQQESFIGLFYHILTGKVDESVYHGQTHLLAHLFKELSRSDTAESGVLSTQEFSEALRRAFPFKAERDVEELVAAAQAELGNNASGVPYQSLYTEDAEGDPEAFLSLLKKQAGVEKHHYITELRTQLEGKGEIEVADLEFAFKSIDPSLSQTKLDFYLGIAFQMPPDQLEKLNARLDTDQALHRLQVADINRAGPRPPQN